MGRPPCRSHKLAHYTARRGRASRAHPPSSSVWTFPPSLKKPSHWAGLLRQPVSAQKLRPNAQPVSAEPATSAQAVATQPVTAQHVTAQHVDEKVAYEAPHGQDESTIPYKQPPRPGSRSDFNDVPTKTPPITAKKPPPQFTEHASLAAKPQKAPPPLPTDAVSLWRLCKLIPEMTCGLTLDL